MRRKDLLRDCISASAAAHNFVYERYEMYILMYHQIGHELVEFM